MKLIESFIHECVKEMIGASYSYSYLPESSTEEGDGKGNEVFEREYKVLTSHMSSVESTIEKVNKKLTKLGLPLMSLYDVKEVDSEGGKDIRSYVKFKIKGDPPKLPGYELIARIDWQGGPMIFEVPGKDMPTKFRTGSSKRCDHCKKSMNRNTTFIVFNTNKKEYIQVGKQCLKDFLGHNNEAKKVAAYFEMAMQAGYSIGQLQSDNDDYDENGMGGGGRGRGDPYSASVSLNLFVQIATAYTMKYGYKKTTEGNYSTLARTLDLMVNIFSDNNLYRKEAQEKHASMVTDEVKKEAAKSIEWAKNIAIDDKTSNYLHNLKTIAQKPYIDEKVFGIAASLYKAYISQEQNVKNKEELQAKWKKEKEDRDKLTQNSEWVGEEGKRLDFDVTFQRQNSFETDYGLMVIANFLDKDGNVIVVKSTSMPDGYENATKIKGTVKQHSEYKGTKQTVINRIKILEPKNDE